MSGETAPERPLEVTAMRNGAVAFIFVTILLDMFALGMIPPPSPSRKNADAKA